jgi:hypothetical protein
MAPPSNAKKTMKETRQIAQMVRTSTVASVLYKIVPLSINANPSITTLIIVRITFQRLLAKRLFFPAVGMIVAAHATGLRIISMLAWMLPMKSPA